MPPATNPIDITTLAAVKAWANVLSVNEDQIIQDAITAFSAYVLHQTGRGNADGSIPTTSPFNTPTSYDELYDGTGNDMLPIRNWPITAVSSVNAGGITVTPSQGITNPGYIVDQSKKFLVLRGGAPGYFRGVYGRGFFGGRGSEGGPGWPLGTQNIEVQYTAGFAATPFDLEMMARKVVSLFYKRRGWIGQRMQMMAQGAGSVSYTSDWNIDPTDKQVLFYYRAIAA